MWERERERGVLEKPGHRPSQSKCHHLQRANTDSQVPNTCDLSACLLQFLLGGRFTCGFHSGWRSEAVLSYHLVGSRNQPQAVRTVHMLVPTVPFYQPTTGWWWGVLSTVPTSQEGNGVQYKASYSYLSPSRHFAIFPMSY